MQPIGNIDQSYESRHFNQRANDTRKCLSAVDTKDTYCYCHRSFKIILSGRECYGGIGGVIGSYFPTDKKTDQEHDSKVYDQRNGDSNHIK
ncbi:MAG: hypothetical protein WKI04_08325 [Ferruginibacter sp.]